MQRTCLVTWSCPTLCNTLGCSPPGSSVNGIFQARILECVAILQRIFLSQRLNPCRLCLLHCRQILYLLNHQGSQAKLNSKKVVQGVGMKLRQESRSVSKSHIHSTVQCCLHHNILLFPWRILSQELSGREEQGFVHLVESW